jgi:hypothetical protein
LHATSRNCRSQKGQSLGLQRGRSRLADLFSFAARSCHERGNAERAITDISLTTLSLHFQSSIHASTRDARKLFSTGVDRPSRLAASSLRWSNGKHLHWAECKWHFKCVVIQKKMHRQCFTSNELSRPQTLVDAGIDKAERKMAPFTYVCCISNGPNFCM